ncbi:hypothetical protein FQN52_001792 [Onygenales sp. PD_12]|nr:hypothetical protein FQN52_001792 [Onygenales sp. PD_12]
MPGSGPRARTLFSLVPLNDHALRVVMTSENRHLLSLLDDGSHALDLGAFIQPRQSNVLATIGRNGDIKVKEPGVANIQCSFEQQPTTKEVMLSDRSADNTTQVSGVNCFPFVPGRRRRVVVRVDVNTEIGFGGPSCDLFQFAIVWYGQQVRFSKPQQGIRVSFDESQDPAHAQAGRLGKIRYVQGRSFGRGTSGEVSEALDVDTGNIMAVKTIMRPAGGWSQEKWIELKRGIDTISSVSHPKILQYIGCQNLSEKTSEVFTDRLDGNVLTLADQNAFQQTRGLANSLMKDMLQALDYLSTHHIIHYAVKPENILYKRAADGTHTFQLSDTNFSALTRDPRAIDKCRIFHAPEILNRKPVLSTKIDVWALYVTLIYLVNVSGHRLQLLHSRTDTDLIEVIRRSTHEACFNDFAAMATVEPTARATSGQMLARNFQAPGLPMPPSPPVSMASQTQKQKQKQQVVKNVPIHVSVPVATPPPTTTTTAPAAVAVSGAGTGTGTVAVTVTAAVSGAASAAMTAVRRRKASVTGKNININIFSRKQGERRGVVAADGGGGGGGGGGGLFD